MITNKYEIEIERIRDLKSVHFIDLADNTDEYNNGYLTLKITYEKDKGLKYNYLDEQFPLFLRKVVDLYSNTTNKKDILILGKNTEKILRELESLYKQVDNENKEIPYVQDYPIVENSTQRFNVEIIDGIIKDLSKSLIFLDTDARGYTYTGIKGYKDRYSITYKRNNIDYFIPISINKDGQNYIFKTSNIGKNIFNINGYIKFYDDSIITSWLDENSMLKGNVTYSINPTEEQNIVKYGEKIIGLNRNSNTLEERDKNIVGLYASLYNINIEKLNKCSENIYISESKTESDDIISIKNGYFNINDNLVNIKIKTKREFKYDGNYSFLLENEDMDIILREVTIDDKKFILEQINYLPTRSTGEYKYFYQNKYNYKLYEINNEDSLNERFTIKNIINIDEAISSFDDLKGIIDKSMKGAKTYGVI